MFKKTSHILSPVVLLPKCQKGDRRNGYIGLGDLVCKCVLPRYEVFLWSYTEKVLRNNSKTGSND